MTRKQEMFKEYYDHKDEIDFLVLHIEMPTGETECVVNSNVKAKLERIDRDYDDDLFHKSENRIYIREWLFNISEDEMDFSSAILALKEGKRVQRKGWNGKSQYIELASNISYQDPEGLTVNADHSAAGNRAIAFVGTSGVQLGWLASQADMLAEDWVVVE